MAREMEKRCTKSKLYELPPAFDGAIRIRSTNLWHNGCARARVGLWRRIATHSNERFIGSPLCQPRSTPTLFCSLISLDSEQSELSFRSAAITNWLRSLFTPHWHVLWAPILCTLMGRSARRLPLFERELCRELAREISELLHAHAQAQITKKLEANFETS